MFLPLFPKSPSSRPIGAVLVLLCGLLALPGAASAFSGPGTVTLNGGKTLIRFAPQFFNLFPALGGQIQPYGAARLKGNLNRQNQRMRFPLASATLTPVRPGQDLGLMDFNHRGGLVLTRTATGVSLLLNAPTFRAGRGCWASAQCLEFGATLVANGAAAVNLPSFAQSSYMINSFRINNQRQVVIRNLPLALSQAGARLLNELFGLQPEGSLYLREGAPFGTADITGNGAKVVCPAGQVYRKKQQQCVAR